MAIQTINLGTYANDGTGDDLRSAFQKVNNNILELANTVVVAYNLTAETTTGGASLALNGTDLSVDSIKFAAGDNITIARTDASTITISSTASGGSGNLDFGTFSAPAGFTLDLGIF